MITLTKRDYEWRDGLTVEALLNKLSSEGRYSDAINDIYTMVVINDKIITKDKYRSTEIKDKDIIYLMPLSGGG